MHKIILILLLLAGAFPIKAQTYEEWARQKATQKKYLLEQIAALKVYGSYLKQGYTIVRDGLGTIQQIKNGDLMLHSGYFNSLRTVNPVIKRYPRAKDILAMQQQVSRVISKSEKQINHAGMLTTGERDYVKRVYARLSQDGNTTLDELERVISTGYQMTDDERIKRIDKLYVDSQSQVAFVYSFSKAVSLLALARKQEQNDIKTSRLLYGIKK